MEEWHQNIGHVFLKRKWITSEFDCFYRQNILYRVKNQGRKIISITLLSCAWPPPDKLATARCPTVYKLSLKKETNELLYIVQMIKYKESFSGSGHFKGLVNFNWVRAAVLLHYKVSQNSLHSLWAISASIWHDLSFLYKCL